MIKRVSAAQAKATLSTLLSEVAYGGRRVIIERHGKPVAALVSMEELERLEQAKGSMDKLPWPFALAGAWGDLSDEEIDSFVRDVYASRERDPGRPVELE
jgi:prevent-host-death family protein